MNYYIPFRKYKDGEYEQTIGFVIRSGSLVESYTEMQEDYLLFGIYKGSRLSPSGLETKPPKFFTI